MSGFRAVHLQGLTLLHLLLAPAYAQPAVSIPDLRVSRLNSRQIQLSWSVAQNAPRLQHSPQLGPLARWVTVPDPPIVDQQTATITLFASERTSFYRLQFQAGATALLPSVRLISPSPNTTLPVPFSTTVQAFAQAPAGTIDSVEFLANGLTLGLDREPPYEITWSHPSPGTFELFARATDSSGAVVRSAPVTLLAFDPAQPPPTTWTSSPAPGDRAVAVNRETVFQFSHPLAPDLVLRPTDITARAGDRALLTRLELAADRRSITVFYLEPLPGSSRIRLTLQGDRLRDARGRFVDADRNGTYGGTGTLDFDTLSTTPLAQSAIVGRVFASQLQSVGLGTNAFVNTPLGGVTITLDGQEESSRTVTDALGNFRLAPVPTGPFFVHIDGRTATDPIRAIRYPDLAYYPNVNKRWEGLPGQEVRIDDIFLPLIPAGTLRPILPNAPTLIQFEAEFVAANPQFDGVRIVVPPNSLYGPNGVRGGQVGIAAVPPDRLPQPLPLGLAIQDVITIQTDGGQNFAEPVPACFPNLPDPSTGFPLPPRSKSALWSFNHDTGRFEIVGSATVSDDGRLVCTDPGVGIVAPGWHGTRDGTQGGGGPILAAPPGSGPGSGPAPDFGPGSSPQGPGPNGPGPIHGGGGPDSIHQPPGSLDGPAPGGPDSTTSRHGPNPGRGSSDSNDTTDRNSSSNSSSNSSESGGGGGGGGGGGDRDAKDEEEEDDCFGIGTAGKPISLFSGEEQVRATDLRLPGRGLDLVWTRTYRSRTGTSTPMGHHWDHSYNVGLYPQGADLVLRDGAGRQDLYRLHPDGSYRRDEFFRRILTERDGSLTVSFANQGSWNFHPIVGTPQDGRLRELRDRNGNRLRFDYDAVGRLTNILDTLDRSLRIAYHTNGFIASLTDFTGRQVRYTYYGDDHPNGSPGDLATVTSPAVLAATSGNTYPNGRTTTYTYSRGFSDRRLNHNLLSITDPKGQTYVRNTYAPTTDPADLLFDRVIRQQHGNPGEVYDFTYLPIAPSPSNALATLKTIVNDRVGNVSELFFDARNRLVIQRDFTGRAIPNQPTTDTQNRPRNPVRASDPAFFETRTTYNDDGLPVVETHPNGNRIEYVYESDLNPAADPEARANIRIRRAVAGFHTPAGDQTVLEDAFEYATGLGSGGCCGGGFNFVTRHVDPNGHETVHRYDERGNRTNSVGKLPSAVVDYEYNAFGQLTAKVHPDNGSGHRRRDTYTYHATGPQRGYVASETIDAAGFALTTRFDYDPRGNLTRITSPRGHVTVTDYNEVNRPWRRTSAEPVTGSGLRYTTEFSYDANNNLTRLDVANLGESGPDPANPTFSTSYTYGILNELLSVSREVDPSRQVVTEQRYDANRNLVLLRSGEAVAGRQPLAVVSFAYDERNLRFRRTQAPGSSIQATDETDYDGNANPIEIRSGIEQNPRIRRFVYDAFNRLVVATDPMGNRTRYTYDPNGNTVTERVEGESPDLPGSDGNVRLSEIIHAYDALDRRTRTTVAWFDTLTQAPIGDGAVTLDTVFSPNSQVLRAVNDNGHFASFTYDTANRPHRITDAVGNTTTYTYDASSNPVLLTQTDVSDLGSPDQVFVISNRFDNLNRLIAFSDSIGQSESFIRDSRNNVVRQIDALGNITRNTYDGLDRLVESEQFLTDTGTGSGTIVGSIRTRRVWDDNSRQTQITDPNGHTTVHAFDELDRQTTLTRADGTTQTVVYDVHHNAVETLDASGTRTWFTHDSLNRRTRAEFTPGPGIAPDTTFTAFRYDGLSRLIRAEDDDSLVLRDFDSLSHVIRESLNGAVTSARYDGLGNLLQRTHPSGRTLTFTHDALERLESVSDPDGVLVSYAYQGPFRIERRTFGNETRTDVDFDAVRRPARITHSRAPYTDNERIDDLQLGWSATSQKAALDRVLPGGDLRRFAYDSSERLVTSSRTPFPAGATDTTRYELDPAGNRLRVTGGPTPGAYTLQSAAPVPADAQVHQYSSTPFDTRAYDARGNAITLGPVIARYDVHDRLVQYQRPGISASYRYDALGRRIEKAVIAGTPAADITRYAYDGPQILEEYDANGILRASYAYGQYLDEVVAIDRAGERFFLHADDQYSVTRVTDIFGDLVEAYDYDDFGEPLILAPDGTTRTVSALANPWLFTGRYWDAESGWYEFQSRHYDPRAGRFLSRDPAGDGFDPEALGNPFTFLANSPLVGTDPSGLDPEFRFNQTFGDPDSVRRYYRDSHLGQPSSKTIHRAWENADPASHHHFISRDFKQLPAYQKPVDALAYGFNRGQTEAGKAIVKTMDYGMDVLHGPMDLGRKFLHQINKSRAAGEAGGEEGYWQARQGFHEVSPEIRNLIRQGIKNVYHIDLDDAAITWEGYEHEYEALKANPNVFIHDHVEKVLTEEGKKKLKEKTVKPATAWCKDKFKKVAPNLGKHLP